MVLRERLLRAGFTLASYVIYGRGDHADWAYEKIQRPATCWALAMNFAAYYGRIPRLYRLTSIMLEPVFGCNLRCQMCWGRLDFEGRRPRFMEWEIYCKLIDQIPGYVESVTFSLFGEPLLHPRLCEMIEYAAARGFRTSLATNATLLKGELLERVARTPLSVLNVSFETNADTAREMRGIELTAIRRNVEAFIAAKRPETEVKLYFIAREDNQAQIAQAVAEWKGLVQHIKISPYVGMTDDEGPLPVCIEPWRGNMNVFTNGNVSPCCFDWYNDMVIGNLYEQDFGEIIHGRPYYDLLRRILDRRAPKRCAVCKEFDVDGVPLRIRKRFPHGTSK